MSSDTEELRCRIHSLHSGVLSRLREVAISDTGTTAVLPGASPGKPPVAVFPSILHSDTEIHVLASNIMLALVDDFCGWYPPRSRLIVVSVGARLSRNGTAVDLDEEEADTWGSALAPAGYEHTVVRLGVMHRSPSRAVHYRYILGPDRNVCIIDHRDRALMRTNFRYN